jgi:uncharacterized protein involved in exopolysaccharide biosynthesis
MATSNDDILRSLVDTLHIYRESHDRRFDRLEQQLANLGDKIETLAGTLANVTSTMSEFTQLTREQNAVAVQQTDNVARLIELAQQQQDAISTLLARN